MKKRYKIIQLLIILLLFSCQNGKDGLDGQNGKDGLDGQNGKDGLDGQNGKDGLDGQNGKDNTKYVFLDANNTIVENVFHYKNDILYIDSSENIWKVDESIWALSPVYYFCMPIYYTEKNCLGNEYQHQNMLGNFVYECNEQIFSMPIKASLENVCSYKHIEGGECYNIDNCQLKYVFLKESSKKLKEKPTWPHGPLHFGRK
jgi:hypothetical protein